MVLLNLNSGDSSGSNPKSTRIKRNERMLTTSMQQLINGRNKRRDFDSYGSCDLPLLEEHQSEDDDESLSLMHDDEEAGLCFLRESDDDGDLPPPSPPPIRGYVPGLRRNHTAPTTSARHRRVSFQGEDDKMSCSAQSTDFQSSWRRKSSRRISLLLQQRRRPPPRKTAKEHWAILREHVKSGRFFLDSSDHSTYGGGISTRDSYLQKRHSHLARSLKKEIRTSHSFTCQQCLMAIAGYLLLAVLCFSLLLPETRHSWTMIDSMYFAVVTFTTIGFGDLTPPDTHLARLVTCAFALTGVATLGLFLGVLGTRLVELETEAMNKAQNDVLSVFGNNNNKMEEEALQEIKHLNHQLKRHALHQKQLQQSTNSLNKHLWWTENLQKIPWLHQLLQPQTLADAPCNTEACRRHKEFYLAASSSKAKATHTLSNINLKFILFLAWLVVLSWFIGKDAGWDFSQTLYFAITTSCTIGYGDKVPTSQFGRLCVVVFVPFAVGAMGFFLQQVAEKMLASKQQRLFGDNSGGCKRELTVMDLEAMDSDGDGNVDWSEFLEFMLVAMDKVDEDLLWELRYQFDSLDVDDTGVLSKANLIALARRKLRQSSIKLQLQQYKQHLIMRQQSSQSQQSSQMSSVSSLGSLTSIP